MKIFKIVFSVTLIFSLKLNAQQVPDTLFHIKIEKPTHTSAAPLVYIDETHNNFHTLSGNFSPLVKLLRLDGYQPKPYTSETELEGTCILVIANPIHPTNRGNWRRPIHPAFPEEEIHYLKNWVENGGRLLLIADHMPFAGAASTLAEAFGFNFCDGFAFVKKEKGQPDIFSVENKRLQGVSFLENIQSVTSFTGSAFGIPPEAVPVLMFLDDDVCLKPEVAWQFNDSTEKMNLRDYYQGAVMPFGKGKIAVFGEAGMFTAQKLIQGNEAFHFGFNSPDAPNNIQFIRNLFNWLSQNN